MIERRIRVDVKLWLTVMAAIAMVLMPMAADASHVEEASESHCEFCIDHADHDHEDGNHHQDHHAHGCGSCHVHNMTPKISYALSDRARNTSDFAMVTAAISSTEISGPYKPPRL